MSLVVYSGGLDSTVLLHFLVAKKSVKAALWVDYGQRHKREFECAKYNCQKLGIPLDIADLSNLAPLFGNNALTNSNVEVPSGDYAEDNMKTTVVPNRNMIMIAVATARAIAIGAESVAYAAHGGDHDIYPDCRPQFTDALANVLKVCHYEPIELERPFVNMSKTEIVTLGAELNVNFAKTWSCYAGGEKPCGVCGTCKERAQAFKEAGLIDPLA